MNDVLIMILALAGVLLLTLVYADEIEDTIREFIDFVTGRF